ncbi:1-phosphatidylinositol 3-phosphate 5-kinase-like [Amphiura filiformis]|uniref:1-phosphatidylinositol 3-phosphate 5-kinase-like n=1 Tax=Amphiura filiformis TaxID=82378 RepID=UPI003B21BF7B
MTLPRRIDCLDLFLHQHIALQFSSYSHKSSNAPNHCVHPWVVTMEFYRRHDLTLGEFLEKFCFSPVYRCPNSMCDTSMVNHVRRFVHGTGAIYVLLRKLESPIPSSTDKILMWSWCRKCKQVSAIQPMSLDTWHMSFAKYLELRFYGREYSRRGSASPCQHSLHRHHFQYFGQHNMVASFKYSAIMLRELSLPPLPLPHQEAYRSPTSPREEYCVIVDKSKQVFSSILSQIEVFTMTADISQYVEQKQMEFILSHQADHNKLEQHLGELQTKIATLASLMPPQGQTDVGPLKKVCYVYQTPQDVSLATFEVYCKLKRFDAAVTL